MSKKRGWCGVGERGGCYEADPPTLLNCPLGKSGEVVITDISCDSTDVSHAASGQRRRCIRGVGNVQRLTLVADRFNLYRSTKRKGVQAKLPTHAGQEVPPHGHVLVVEAVTDYENHIAGRGLQQYRSERG